MTQSSGKSTCSRRMSHPSNLAESAIEPSEAEITSSKACIPCKRVLVSKTRGELKGEKESHTGTNLGLLGPICEPEEEVLMVDLGGRI